MIAKEMSVYNNNAEKPHNPTSCLNLDNWREKKEEDKKEDV